VTNWYVRPPIETVSPADSEPEVPPSASNAPATVSVKVSWAVGSVPLVTFKPVALKIAPAPSPFAEAESSLMLRPSVVARVRRPVLASATALTPVWFVTALMAVAALRPWVTALALPAMAPTATPLITSSPFARLVRAIGAVPCTELAAVALTPVWLVLELMAVAFAVALSASTPAALVFAEIPTSTPLIVKPAPSKAVEVTAVLVAW
jgi:hypothetical protein